MRYKYVFFCGWGHLYIYVWWTHNIFFISFGRWVNVSSSINALDVNGLSSSEDAKSIDKKTYKNIITKKYYWGFVEHLASDFLWKFLDLFYHKKQQKIKKNLHWNKIKIKTKWKRFLVIFFGNFLSSDLNFRVIFPCFFGEKYFATTNKEF